MEKRKRTHSKFVVKKLAVMTIIPKSEIRTGNLGVRYPRAGL
jgi:hypothetical protein